MEAGCDPGNPELPVHPICPDSPCQFLRKTDVRETCSLQLTWNSPSSSGFYVYKTAHASKQSSREMRECQPYRNKSDLGTTEAVNLGQAVERRAWTPQIVCVVVSES